MVAIFGGFKAEFSSWIAPQRDFLDPTLPIGAKIDALGMLQA